MLKSPHFLLRNKSCLNGALVDSLTKFNFMDHSFNILHCMSYFGCLTVVLCSNCVLSLACALFCSDDILSAHMETHIEAYLITRSKPCVSP